MATLTRHRPPPQRNLLDPVEGERRTAPRFPTRFAQSAAPAGTRPAPPLTRPAQPPAASSTDATLDYLVAGMWESLQATHTAECLACGTDVTPRFGSGPHPVAATCGSCGSQLS